MTTQHIETLIIRTPGSHPARARARRRCGPGHPAAAVHDLAEHLPVTLCGRYPGNEPFRPRLRETDLPGLVEAPCELSPREVEVLRLVAVGRSNGEIPAMLFLSNKTAL